MPRAISPPTVIILFQKVGELSTFSTPLLGAGRLLVVRVLVVSLILTSKMMKCSLQLLNSSVNLN